MKILSAHFKNYKCFEDFKIEFNSNYNLHVILAENMAGKSAILKGLRTIISQFFDGFMPQNQIKFAKMDHRVNGLNPYSDVENQLKISAKIIIRTYHKQYLPCELSYEHHLIAKSTKVIAGNHSLGWDFNAEEFYNNPPDSGRPIFLYVNPRFPSGKRVSDKDSDDLMLNAPDGWLYCLDSGFKLSQLKNRIQKLNEIIQDSANGSITNELFAKVEAPKIFECIVSSIKKINDDVIDVEWSMAAKELAFRFNNKTVRFYSQLSDGYKYLILLACELGYRAATLNKLFSEEEIFKIPGVVLIDEFGVHLHPTLQNQALQRLQKAFPNVQFIITTHSPMLVNGLKKEQVHILEKDKDTGKRTMRYPKRDIEGYGAEGILIELFGLDSTFDKATQKLQKEYGDLLSKKYTGKLTPEEREKFIALKEQMALIRFEPSFRDELYERFLDLLEEKNSCESVVENPLSDEQIMEVLNQL